MRRPSIKRGNISNAAAVRKSSMRAVPRRSSVDSRRIRRRQRTRRGAVDRPGGSRFFPFRSKGQTFEIVGRLRFALRWRLFFARRCCAREWRIGIAVMLRNAHGYQFLVPARQCALSEQRLEKAGDAFAISGRWARTLNMLGTTPRCGEQGVVDFVCGRRVTASRSSS